jgi:[ribosomal protein S5]-alanine N-acetyltransferase
MSAAEVRIVQLPPEAIIALAAGDLVAANRSAPVELTPWLVAPESIGVWRFRARQVVETPADLAWFTGALQDLVTGVVVGKAGFHAAPDADGMVEMGYGVDPAFRRRGYARAALLILLERARAEPTVHTLRATISPDNAASLGLIAQFPFVEAGEQWDEEYGLEIIYEMPV